MSEKNQVKDSYSIEKVKKHQNLCIFTHLYPLLLRLGKPEEVTKKLKRHILTNRPHLVSPQQTLEVFQTYILGRISCFLLHYFLKTLKTNVDHILDKLFLGFCLYDSYFYFSNLIISSPLSKIG